MNIGDFSPVVPTDGQVLVIKKFNDLYLDLATAIRCHGETKMTSLEGPHITAALRLLLESKMTLIHGITHPFQG